MYPSPIIFESIKLIEVMQDKQKWQLPLLTWVLNFLLCSVLIRICGESGDCKQAERLLKEQLKAAESDINCQPSAITCR